MKLIFLDIDGVLNCASTQQRHRGAIGIDPYMVAIFNRIIFATGANIVLSSTWRLWEETREEVRKQVMGFIGVTPHIPMFGGAEQKQRGKEIMRWLVTHPKYKDARYAILDDDSDFYHWQPLFKTSWQTGLTQEIADKVIKHLNHEELRVSPTATKRSKLLP